MSNFTAAMMMMDNVELVVIKVDKKFMDDDETLGKYIKYYQDLLKKPNVAIMMVDDDQNAIYYAKKELVEVLKRGDWKDFPWKQYSLELPKKPEPPKKK